MDAVAALLGPRGTLPAPTPRYTGGWAGGQLFGRAASVDGAADGQIGGWQGAQGAPGVGLALWARWRACGATALAGDLKPALGLPHDLCTDRQSSTLRNGPLSQSQR